MRRKKDRQLFKFLHIYTDISPVGGTPMAIPIKNQPTVSRSGFTLIEVMLATGVIAVSTLALVSFTKISLEVDRKTRTKQNISQAKAEVINILSNQDLWLTHVTNAGSAHPTLAGATINDDLSCIRDRSACVESQHPLTLMDSSSKIIVDPQVTTQGFTANGEVCSTFGDNTDNNPCIYRLELKWSPVCPVSGACVDPQVKVNITLKNYDSVTLTTNELETLPYTLLTDTIKARAPVVKAFALATNSAIYYPTESEISIDPLPYIFNEYKTNYTLSLPNSETAAGNNVSITSNHIVYTPSPAYYGLDRVDYTVTDQRSGLTTAAHLWVKVMTPYTWIGKAGDYLASSTQNFCGKVIMGVCDSLTYPSGGHDKIYIFNETCDTCTAELNLSPISGIDMESNYPGSVKLMTSLVVQPDGYNNWKKIPLFHQGAGSFVGNDRSMKVIGSGWGYAWDYSRYAFVIDSGRSDFTSPNNLKISGPVSINNGNNFHHANGKVTFYSFYGTKYDVTAPGVHFYDVAFDDKNERLGNSYGFNVTSDFFVHHDLFQNPYNIEGAISGYGNISLYGDIYLTGFGGSYNNSPGKPATISLVGTNDQTIYGVTGPSLPANDAWSVLTGTAFLPFVKFNKPSGSVIAKDWVGFEGLDAINTPAFDTSAATFAFGIDSGINVWRSGDFTYQNAYIVTGGSGCGDMFFDSDTIKIMGNFYSYTRGCSHPYGKYDAFRNALMDDSHSPTVLEVAKDVIINNGFDHDRLDRAVTLKMVGSNDAVVQSSLSSVSAYNLLIAKTDLAKVTIKGGYTTARGITSLGTLPDGGNRLIIDSGVTVRVPGHGWNNMKSVFNVPNVMFHNIDIDHGFVLASDINMDGNLTWGKYGGSNYSLSLNSLLGTTNYQFYLNGNLNIEGNLVYGGGVPVNMIGTADSEINTVTTSRVYSHATKLVLNKTNAAVTYKSRDIWGGPNSYSISTSALTVGATTTLNVDGGLLTVAAMNTLPGGVVNYNSGGQICVKPTSYTSATCYTGP